MRTMKKMLALSVVLATLFSLTAFASFKDEQSIRSDLLADVELLTALNIIKGDTQGNFNPEKSITRAEAAKMIYVLKMKGVDDGAKGWAGASTFSDTRWHWAEGYIAYCASLGILDGVGNGRFNPEGKVTGTELGKMLLVLAGYKTDYTGFGWQQAVIADGVDAGLFEDYDLAYTAASPRQWAAKLFTNTITAVKKPVYIMGEIVAYGDTYGVANLEMVMGEGVVMATRDIELDATPAANENGKNLYSKVKSDSKTYLLNYDIPDSLLGQKVTFITRGEPSENQGNDVKVYGVSAVKSSAVTVDFDEISGKKSGSEYILSVGGEEYTYANENVNLDVYVNYAPQSQKKVSELSGVRSTAPVKLCDTTGDGLFDTALITEVNYAEVSQINAEKNIFKTSDATGTDVNVSGNKDEFARYTFNDTVAKGDIVAITPVYDSGSERFVVSLASAFEGDVSSFSVGSDGKIASVIIGGSEYRIASDNMFPGGEYTDAMTAHRYYYTDGRYIILSKGEPAVSAEDQKNIALVTDVAKVQNTDIFGNPAGTYTVKVQIVKNDGKTEILDYFVPASTTGSVIGTNGNNGENNYSAVNGVKGRLVEYVMNDGKVYFKTLATVPSGDIEVKTATGVLRYTPADGRLLDVTMSDSSVQDTHATYLTDENTLLFVQSEDADGNTVYSVLHASELKGITTGTTTGKQVAVTRGMPTVRYAHIVLDSVIPGESVSGSMALGSDSYSIRRDDSANRWVISYKVTDTDGASKTLTMHGSMDDYAALTNVTGRMNAFIGKLIEYTETDGIVDLKDGVKAGLTGFNQGTLTGYSQNTAYIGGFYTVDEDTRIVYVDVDQTVGDGASKAVITTGSGLPLAGTYGDNDEHTYQNNVYYKLTDGTSHIETIFVEVDGETLTGANGIF